MKALRTLQINAGILALLSSSALAGTQPNIVPVTVDGFSVSMNVLFVDVTICVPGTNQCQTIPHIQLDTGSSGLRVLSSLITIPLPHEKDVKGNTLAECFKFGGGDVLWGSVGLADIVLGGDKALSVPVQVVDSNFNTIPSDCINPVTNSDFVSSEQMNGILGIAIEPQDSIASYNFSYYSCEAATCQSTSTELSQQLSNPINFFPLDNNGYSITLPAIPANGSTSPINGTLTRNWDTNQ